MSIEGREAALSYPEELRSWSTVTSETIHFSRGDGVDGARTAGLDEAYVTTPGPRRASGRCLPGVTVVAIGPADRRFPRGRGPPETIHTYSLVHDDPPAMDDDDLRRGKPTSMMEIRRGGRDPGGRWLRPKRSANWPLSGNPGTGVLEPVAKAQRRDRVLERWWWPVHRRLGPGPGRGRAQAPPFAEDRPGSSGPASKRRWRSGGVTEASREPFRRFATQIGLLFQIVDDIPDVTGKRRRTGNPCGGDTSVTER